MNRGRATRDFGLDAVRGGAVVAMIIAHTVTFIRPTAPETLLRIDSVLSDLASPLFALVIGATVVLVGGPAAAGAEAGARRRFAVQFAIKGVALVPIGWLLSLRPSGVDVVLGPLGVTIVCAAPLIFLRSRILLGLVAALAIAGPLLNEAARRVADGFPALTETPVVSELLTWFVLGHNYRVTGLLPLLLIGLLLGRNVAGRQRRVFIALVAAGLVFLAAQLARPLGLPGAKVSGTHVDLARDIGLAVGCWAAVLLLVRMAPRVCSVLLRPLAVQGRMALSVYVGHVLVLVLLRLPPVSVWVLPRLTDPKLGWGIQLGLLLLCWVASELWWRRFGTGPVERLIGVISGRRRGAWRARRRSRGNVSSGC